MEMPYKDLSAEEINAMPIIAWQGKVVIVVNAEDALKAAKELQEEKIIGFDTESRPSFKKGESYPVSLLQLAGEKCVYLFRLLQFKMPMEIVQILENPEQLKVGVAIRDDLKGLKKHFSYKPKGMVELSTLTDNIGLKSNGLRGLTGSILHGRLSKKAKMSNWEAKDFSPEQILYAASDAWAGREIYLKVLPYLNQQMIDKASFKL